MKGKKPLQKLQLNKITVAGLDNQQQRDIRGGYLWTNMYDNCYTWDPICPTQYRYVCTYQVCPTVNWDNCPSLPQIVCIEQ